jgi:hypothetical protein
MNTKNLFAGLIAGAWLVLAAGCGGSGSSGDDSPPAPPPPPPPPLAVNHTVGGSVAGLSGTLVLEINGGDALTLGADGAFTFSNALAAGSSYSVTVRTQPANQICTVSDGDGTIADAAVTNVAVTCAMVTRTVGGSVYGLAPSESLVLQNNGGDALTLDADGTFTFSNAVAAGSSYAVTVRNQPANQLCTVDNGSGVVADAAIANVTVNCSTLTRIVGGTVSGLDPSESVVLQNNSGDNLVVNANGNFVFAAPVAQSGAYDVTVLTQPAAQTCTVTNGGGTAGASDIADVQVTCSTNAYTVGGTVSGLSGTVVLQNNGADNLPLASSGAFTFSTPVAQGAPYNITVLTQPAIQTCTVTNGSGTMGGANVTNVSVSCSTNTTTLAISLSDLALSVTGLTEYGLVGTSSGAARTITITNTGSDMALNVSVSPPTWPAGTTSSTNCGSTLAAGGDCAITVTPGNTASSNGTDPCSVLGTAPIPGVIQVTADNANTVSSNAVVLSYGCIYQGGHVYALDDAGSTSQSVGGKVAATTDQALPGAIWGSDALGNVAFDAIYGISEISVPSSPNPTGGGPLVGQSECNGATDGTCNTNNIYQYYQTAPVGAPINSSLYAAGRCKQTISGYSDWSLPAICELGYDSAACNISGTPRLQNMQSSLMEFNSLNLLLGFYWSSTEWSAAPNIAAWSHFFDPSGGAQASVIKNNLFGVRCSRALSQ